MLIQAIVDQTKRMNLPGDVLALFLVAVVLFILTPRKNSVLKQILVLTSSLYSRYLIGDTSEPALSLITDPVQQDLE